MLRILLFFLLVCGLGLSLALSPTLVLDAYADEESKDKEGEEEESEEEKGPFKKFDEVTEDAKLLEGFFDLYEKSGTLLMAIKPGQLDMDFLMNFEIAQGVGAAGLNGGTMLGIFQANLMALQRHGDKIYLVQHPVHMTATDESDAWKATMERSFGSSVVAAAGIETIREDDEAILIDVTEWFVSDISGVSQRVKFAVSTTPGKPGQASLDAARSYVEWAKTFPKNVSIRTKLTFTLNEPPSFDSLADWRSLPLAIHANIVQLPDVPMEPRVADERTGYFLTVHKDFSRDERTFFSRYVNKWRLERGDKDGKLYKPKKQIVYYIDPSVPAEHRQAVKAGVEAWNKAYEKAGFKNAIKARMLPEGADAEDIRYPTIRWVASDQPQYLAIGPSIVDPRTGEVLDADILMDALFALRTTTEWRNLVDPATALAQAIGTTEVTTFPEDELRFEHASFTTQMLAEASLLHASLVDRGVIGVGEPMPAEFASEFMRWVVMHEVGHSLGLRHNFRSSTDTPMDKLHDRTWTEANGLVSSVMDYAAANVAPNGKTNGQYYGTTVGTADDWMIAYGYHYDAEEAERIARLGANKGHAYGTDEDRLGPGAMDPTVNTWDLGADPLAWSEERCSIVSSLLPKLPERVLVDNAPRSDLTSTVQNLMGTYAVSLATALKYVGGHYVYRDHEGDPGARDPFVPVPREKQLRALDHLVENAFSPEAFALAPETIAMLSADRWNHWGKSTTIRGRVDYPYHEQVLSLQTQYLSALMAPFRLARISDGEMTFGAERMITIPELFERVTGAIWSELDDGGNISSTRRNLQRAYVDQLTDLLTSPPDRMPSDARAVARLTVTELFDSVDSSLGRGDHDTYTLAHLAEVRERLEMALEAGLEVQMLAD